MESPERICNQYSLIKSNEDCFLYYYERERFFVALSPRFKIDDIPIENYTVDPIKTPNIKKSSLKAVDIIPGNDCNLSCSYCYRKCNSRTITLGDIKMGLDFVKALCDQNNLEFCFIGGEPLLYWKEVMASVDCILNTFPKARFVVVTNGTLFTDEICRYLLEKKFYTIVSIDGNEERHNQARIFKQTRLGAFKAVNSGLNMLKKHGISYALCVTIAKHNSKRFVDDIEWLLNAYEPDDLHVNGILHNANYDKKLTEAFAKGLTSLFDLFNAKKKPLPEQLKRWFLPFISHSEQMHFDCAAFGCKIVMSPEGYHVCEGFASSGNNVPLSYLKKLLDSWSNYSINGNIFCQQCHLRFVCKGGCKFNADKDMLSDVGVDGQYCITNKTLFNHLANSIIADFTNRESSYLVYNKEFLMKLWPSITNDKKCESINWS